MEGSTSSKNPHPEVVPTTAHAFFGKLLVFGFSWTALACAHASQLHFGGGMQLIQLSLADIYLCTTASFGPTQPS